MHTDYDNQAVRSSFDQQMQLVMEEPPGAGAPGVNTMSEQVFTVEELAKNLQVSTRTLSRWRRYGLVSRRFVVDGRERLGFLRTSVDRFVRAHQDMVRRGSEFRRLTDGQRAAIIDNARRMAEAGERRGDLIRHVARAVGCCSETVRYTLRRHDEAHPESAVFPNAHGGLSEETQRQVFQQYQRGESIEAIAGMVRQPQAAIRRFLKAIRARRILELPLDYIPNEQFAAIWEHGDEKEVLGPMPSRDESLRQPRVPRGLPPYLASLYEFPLLTRAQESHLFRKMNYLKYKASRLRQRLDPARPQLALMNRIERCYNECVTVKNEILRANLRLVASIAKRHIGPQDTFFDLVSDGNMSLMRAVEKFDFARGNKFSTYASWAIIRNFARSVPYEYRHQLRFRTGQAEMLSVTEDGRSDAIAEESDQMLAQAQAARIRHLTNREREIIIRRFGLQNGNRPLTLKEIGKALGVTKERVRQIEHRVLDKLREAAASERVECPV